MPLPSPPLASRAAAAAAALLLASLPARAASPASASLSGAFSVAARSAWVALAFDDARGAGSAQCSCPSCNSAGACVWRVGAVSVDGALPRLRVAYDNNVTLTGIAAPDASSIAWSDGSVWTRVREAATAVRVAGQTSTGALVCGPCDAAVHRNASGSCCDAASRNSDFAFSYNPALLPPGRGGAGGGLLVRVQQPAPWPYPSSLAFVRQTGEGLNLSFGFLRENASVVFGPATPDDALGTEDPCVRDFSSEALEDENHCAALGACERRPRLLSLH